MVTFFFSVFPRQWDIKITRSKLESLDIFGSACWYEFPRHLANGSLASGPQFGRLLTPNGEPTAECTPRWNTLRSRLQDRERKRQNTEKAVGSTGPVEKASVPASSTGWAKKKGLKESVKRVMEWRWQVANGKWQPTKTTREWWIDGEILI